MACVSETELETYSILWLDTNTNQNDANQKARQQLRSIINHVKAFNNLDTFRGYIEGVSKQHQLILIVNEVLGRQIAPSIHKLPQVASIYIYNLDKNSSEEWINSFTKVVQLIFVIFFYENLLY